MKKYIKISIAIVILFIFGYFLLGCISSFIGWYGYGKWKYRVASHNVDESKKRGVFVKELNFKIDSFSGKLTHFKPFIEKGFRFGLHSSEVTIPLHYSQYPYQLAFDTMDSNGFGILIKRSDLIRFDSSDGVWGFSKLPMLKDTITLIIRGQHKEHGIIKVWN